MLFVIWWATNLKRALTELVCKEVETVDRVAPSAFRYVTAPREPIQDNSCHNPFFLSVPSLCPESLPSQPDVHNTKSDQQPILF